MNDYIYLLTLKKEYDKYDIYIKIDRYGCILRYVHIWDEWYEGNRHHHVSNYRLNDDFEHFVTRMLANGYKATKGDSDNEQ